MKLGRKPTHAHDTMMTAALVVAARDGYQNMTRQAVADQAGCSAALVSRYFGTMPQLRRSVMRAAVARGDKRVLAQGLAVGDPNAVKATGAAKRVALESLL
jgi:AcrR family transcriptional regulator